MVTDATELVVLNRVPSAMPICVGRPHVKAYVQMASKHRLKNVMTVTCRMATDVRRRVDWNVDTRVPHRFHRGQIARKYVLPLVATASEPVLRNAMTIML